MLFRWYFFTYIHIDFKQAGYNLRKCITKYKCMVIGYGQKSKYFNK